MSSPLARASAILSHLGSEPDRAFTVQEVAQAVAQPTSTCQRLLGQLVELGWADQRGRRLGYRLGPRAYALTTAQPYRARLMSCAQDPAYALAESLQRQVLVAVLRGTTRQTLCEYRPRSGARGGRRFLETRDCYRTSGGRVLLAMQPRSRRDRVIDELGLPTQEAWPGVLTRRELDQELADIRRRRWISLEKGAIITMSVAFPDGEGGWAALGSAGPKESWQTGQEAEIRAVALRLGKELDPDDEGPAPDQ